MRHAMPLMILLAAGALAGCERPASTSSTTVVKEQPTVVKEKETIVQRDVPAPSSNTNVTIETKPQETTEASRTTSTTRIDTPAGTATRTDTQTTTTKK